MNWPHEQRKLKALNREYLEKIKLILSEECPSKGSGQVALDPAKRGFVKGRKNRVFALQKILPRPINASWYN